MIEFCVGLLAGFYLPKVCNRIIDKVADRRVTRIEDTNESESLSDEEAHVLNPDTIEPYPQRGQIWQLCQSSCNSRMEIIHAHILGVQNGLVKYSLEGSCTAQYKSLNNFTQIYHFGGLWKKLQ